MSEPANAVDKLEAVQYILDNNDTAYNTDNPFTKLDAIKYVLAGKVTLENLQNDERITMEEIEARERLDA